jgi:hypothetical protein
MRGFWPVPTAPATPRAAANVQRRQRRRRLRHHPDGSRQMTTSATAEKGARSVRRHRRVLCPILSDRCDDRTVQCFSISFTLVKQVRKCVFHPREIHEPRSNLLDALRSDAPDTAPVPAIFEREKVFDFLKGKPELLCTFDEADAGHMLAIVLTVSARFALGLCDQTSALVVAHGLHADPCRPCGDSDSEIRSIHGALLTPYPSTDLTLASTMNATQRRAA